MINIIVKRSLVGYRSVGHFISKRYLSGRFGDVFNLQERGYFYDNLAEVE